jgi:hypothetical protein
MTHGWFWRALAPTLGLMLACLACGSGSSGFRPRDAELAAILSSAETGACETAPGDLEVCAQPAGPGEGAVCDAQGPGCSFVLTIGLRGLQPGTSVIGAVEPQDLSLPWRTSSNSLGPATAAGELRGDLSFATEIPGGTIALRALVIYPPGVLPPELEPDGIDVDLLADLGAPQANVLVDWPIDAPE